MTTATVILVSLLLLQVPGRPQPAAPVAEPETVVDLRDFACSSFLEIVDAQDGRGEVFLVWAHGYHAAAIGLDDKTARPLTWRHVQEFAEQLQKVCREDPTRNWIGVVRSLKTP